MSRLIGHAGHPEVEGTKGQVQKVIQYLSAACNTAIELKDSEENLSFSLPPGLRNIQV